MHDLPRQKLHELIRRFGASLAEEPSRCKGMLKDLCGEYRKEVSGLLIALEEGIPAELLRSTVSVAIARGRCIRKLRDNRGLAMPVAIWAVDSWALSLNILTQVQIDSMPISDITIEPEIEYSHTSVRLMDPRFFEYNPWEYINMLLIDGDKVGDQGLSITALYQLVQQAEEQVFQTQLAEAQNIPAADQRDHYVEILMRDRLTGISPKCRSQIQSLANHAYERYNLVLQHYPDHHATREQAEKVASSFQELAAILVTLNTVYELKITFLCVTAFSRELEQFRHDNPKYWWTKDLQEKILKPLSDCLTKSLLEP